MRNAKIALISLIVLFGSALCETEASSSIQLSVYSSSNAYWIAVMPIGGSQTTSKIEVQQAGSSVWSTMEPNPGWGYWQLASTGSSTGFSLPLSFRMTATNGQQVIMIGAVKSIGGATIETGSQYGGSGSGSGSSSTKAPTPTQRATSAPTRPTPTQRATSAPSQPTTQRPTQRATTAPTPTQRATQKPTSAPNTNLCGVTSTASEPVKFLVPLYVYPDSSWQKVIDSQKAGIETIAVINPNNGPGSGPDSSYRTWMSQLAAAGVTMIGYVHTTYGDRNVNDVIADINTYATKFPGLAGIFVDEASASASDLTYYKQVFNAAKAKAGYVHHILNPGTQPDQGYLDAGTNIVIFEDQGKNWKGNYASWVTCAPNAAAKAGYKYKFSGIAYASSQSEMTSLIPKFAAAGIGMVYVTDGAAGGNTYNVLPAYWSQQITAINNVN